MLCLVKELLQFGCQADTADVKLVTQHLCFSNTLATSRKFTFNQYAVFMSLCISDLEYCSLDRSGQLLHPQLLVTAPAQSSVTSATAGVLLTDPSFLMGSSLKTLLRHKLILIKYFTSRGPSRSSGSSL